MNQHRNLLLVTDDDPDSHAVRVMLQTIARSRWSLQAIATTHQALTVVRHATPLPSTHPYLPLPAALVLFVHADAADGLEIVTQAARHHPDLPILVVAQQCSDRFAARVFRSGALVDYITSAEATDPERINRAFARMAKHRSDSPLSPSHLEHITAQHYSSLEELEQLIHGIDIGTVDVLLPRDTQGRIIPFMREGSDAIYRLQIEALNVGVLLTDEKGYILSLNPTAAYWLARPQSTLLGQSLFNCGLQMMPGGLMRTADTSFPAYQLALPGKGTDQIGYLTCLGPLTHSSTDGKQSSSFQANFWLLTDVTEELHLRQQDRFLATLLTQLQDGVLVCNLDGTITYLNERARALLDWSNDALTGQSLLDAGNLDLMRLLQQSPESVRQGACPRYEWLAPPRMADIDKTEEYIDQWVELRASPLYDEHNRVMGMLMILNDISARKQMEYNAHSLHEQTRAAYTRLQAISEEMVRAERLRALGQMASGIAHEFNNVLTSILGYAELALNTPAVSAVAREDLKRITVAAHDASAIITRLRTFYRLQKASETHQPVDLHTIVQQAIDLTRPRWRDIPQAHGLWIEVTTDLQAVPLLAGDPIELRELLTNLIFNAVDAMPRGGTICIRTTQQDHSVLLTVSDTGVGMSDDVRHRVFEPFFTTKGEHGSGLGLAICHGIAEHHDASIEIASSVGQGAQISVRFPLKQALPRTQTLLPIGKLPVFNILYIDDDPDVRGVVRKMLESLGQYVECVATGREGLELMNILRFDILVSDLGMPGMTGIETIAAARNLDPRMATVMLTGWGQFIDHRKSTGADYLLSKPVRMDDLRQVLHSVVAHQRLLTQTQSLDEALSETIQAKR